MTELATGPITEVSKVVTSHAEREMSYLINFKRSIKLLKAKSDELCAKEKDVTRRVAAATKNGEVIREVVTTWLGNVEAAQADAKKLVDEAAVISRWYRGWFSFSRFILGRRAEKKIDIIQALLDNEISFGDAVSGPEFIQDLLVTGGIIRAREVKAFPSRVSVTQKIIQALQDDNIFLLGVYGMPGVGKSTLIKALADHVKEQKIFDEVVVVTLTQKPELELIQGEIANKLDLKFKDDETSATRADRLLQRLTTNQKTLIVLDNLWERVELSQVGLPRGLKSCKIVFTTRSQDVCNSMDTGESRIELGILSPNESWKLFREKEGDTLDSLAFRSVATDILNECKGLPLLIVTLRRALYGKRKSFWDAALLSLQTSTILLDPVFADMPHVFSVMKLSYDNLQSEELKLCFLFCCLFPDGYPISEDQLFHYMMGEKLITKTRTFQEARIRLQAIVVNLTSSCLLVQSTNDCVMMHDVVRDVAIAIASDSKEGHGFIVKAGMIVRDWPEVDLDECKRLSLITTTGSQMTWSPPDQIKAVHLSTLSFNGNVNLVELPAGFFKETLSLLTLDLSYTGIKVLPQSITCLVNLRTLLLDGCVFEGVSLSEGLERLEILSLRESTIQSFTVSRNLTTLRLLDLSSTSNLEHISQNIISSFIKLEELYLLNSFRAWEPDKYQSASFSKVKKHGEDFSSPSKGEEYDSSSKRKEGGEEYASLYKGKEKGEEYDSSSGEEYGSYLKEREEYASLSEVASLTRLTSLEFHVGNLECSFQSIPNWENLTRFKIAVGVIDDFSPFGIDDGLQMEKSMYIELDSRVVANWVKVLLERTEFLQLTGSQSLSDILQLDLGPEQGMFSELKVLILSKIGSSTSLISGDQLPRLQNLNKLVVINCSNLERLIEFEALEASSSSNLNTVKFSNLEASSVFRKLTYLRVSECYTLDFLFPVGVIRLLLQLEELYISDCHYMMMIIEDDGVAVNDRKILPKLRVLSLESLFSLQLLCPGNIDVNWPVLEELTVKDCRLLREFPLNVHSVPRLTKLIVDDFAGCSDNWDDSLCRLSNGNSGPEHIRLTGDMRFDAELILDQSYSALRSLAVSNYLGTSLVPRDLLRRFSNLDRLVVRNCGSLEKMIDFRGEEKEGEEQVSVIDTSVASSSSFPVENKKFSKLPQSLVFPNLTVLHVSFCKKLKYLLPERLVREHMVKLKEITIEYCSDMETIIEYDTTADYGCADKDKAVFPDLTDLSVYHCDSLKHLFPMRIIRGMLKLERLSIEDCKCMEMIITHESTKDDGDTEKDKAVLPKLEELTLLELQKLTSFVGQDILFDWPSLTDIFVEDCRSLQKLPLGSGSVPKLETCWLDPKKWSDELQWEDQEVKSHVLRIRK